MQSRKGGSERGLDCFAAARNDAKQVAAAAFLCQPSSPLPSGEREPNERSE